MTNFRTAFFTIKRHGRLCCAGFELGSGFEVELSYSKKVNVDGDVVGIDQEWNLTPQLARFLALNQRQISQRLPIVEKAIQDYRDRCYQECYNKAEVLSYQFLVTAYNRVQVPESLVDYVTKSERDLRVRQTMLGSEVGLRAGYERHKYVSSTEAAAWWYIFWV